MNNELKPSVTIQYSGITVEYFEEPNKWRFELRGRERNAESLKQAKEWIDKPEPVSKKAAKNFERFEVLLAGRWGYEGHKPDSRRIVTVTSIAEDRFRNDVNDPSAAWIVNKAGERSKESVQNLYVLNAANEKKWAEYDALQAHKARIEKEAAAVLKSLETLNLKPYLLGEHSV